MRYTCGFCAILVPDSCVLFPDVASKCLDWTVLQLCSFSQQSITIWAVFREIQRLPQPYLGVRAASVGWSSCKCSTGHIKTAARLESLCRAPQNLCSAPCVARALLWHYLL